MEQEKQQLKRDFQGIWIPSELWLNTDLKPIEIFLLAEITSLDNEDGCFASNEYLAKMLKTNELQITRYISRLKRKNHIYQEKFDGRIRILRSNWKNKLKNRPIRKDEADLSKKMSIEYSIDTSSKEEGENTLFKNNLNNSIIQKSVVKDQEFGNQHINQLILYLKEKNHNYLDGSMAGNRRYCWLLMLKLGYKTDKEKTTEAIKKIIDLAMRHKFHSKKTTNFKYIYNNSHIIMKDAI